ncbi:MAG: hypothetical protein IJH39_04425 [Clostridia bacterium]|nr:hypothetical protein [Clostridia bacterium]
MKTFVNGNSAISVEFDKNFILSGIHKLTSYHKNCKQTSIMFFGLIVTFGFFA